MHQYQSAIKQIIGHGRVSGVGQYKSYSLTWNRKRIFLHGIITIVWHPRETAPANISTIDTDIERTKSKLSHARLVSSISLYNNKVIYLSLIF